MAEINLEDMLLEDMDQIKFLMSPETWGDAILECTKNEVFVLVLLYRQNEVNMTQVADYIEVPLNTATGVITRMEKKKLVCRQRSIQDKRVVTISLTENGRQQVQNILQEFFYYGQKLIEELDTQELAVISHVFDKLIRILKEGKEQQSGNSKRRVKRVTIE